MTTLIKKSKAPVRSRGPASLAPTRRLRMVRVVVNPVSGRGKHLGKVRRLANKLTRMGYFLDVFETSRAGDALEYVRENAWQAGVFVVAGGDGTLNEVVNGNIDTRVPIAVLPAGTGNILAKEFGLPWDVRRICRSIQEKRVRHLDAIEVGSGRYSLLLTSAGFDSSIAYAFHQKRRGTMRMRQYVVPLFREIFAYRYRPLRVTIDGNELPYDAAHVIVGNVRSYGGPFEFASHAVPDDGLLDVLVFRGHRWRQHIRYLWAGLLHECEKLPDCDYFQVREVSVEGAEDLPYQIDGDPAGFLPLRARIVPRSVPLVVAR